MGWLEGLLTGYVGRHHEILDDQAKLEAESRQREAGIYRDLLNSRDPGTYQLAAAGLLSMAETPRRSKGLAGWMGEMEKSPIYARLSQYLQTPQWVPAGPRTPIQGQIPTAPGQAGSAAQPETGPTEGAPLTMPQPSPSVPQLALPPATPESALPMMQGGKPPWTSPFLPNAVPPPAPSPATTEGVLSQPAAYAPVDTAALRAEQGGLPRFTTSGSASAFAPPPPPAPPPPSFTPRASFPAAAAAAPPAPPGRPPLPSFIEEGSWQLPRSFPTGGDLIVQKNRADVEGTIAAYTDMYVAKGLPLDQAHAKAVDLFERDLISSHGAGQSYAEGNIIPDKSSPTGWSQELYLRADPTRKTLIPSQPPNTPEYMAEKARQTTLARGGATEEIGLNPQQRFTGTMGLREDWNQVSRLVREQASAVVQMQAAMNRARKGDIGAGAEAMTVLFQKALDPGSVVRETEARRPAEFAGLTARIRGWFEKQYHGGAPITLDELEKYELLAEQMQRAAAYRLQDEHQRITSFALKNKLDPADIVPSSIEALIPTPSQRTGAAGANPNTAGGPPAPPGAQPAYDWDPVTKTYILRKQ